MQLLETIIELENIQVELEDRCQGDFDEMLSNDLKKVIKSLTKAYKANKDIR